MLNLNEKKIVVKSNEKKIVVEVEFFLNWDSGIASYFQN